MLWQPDAICENVECDQHHGGTRVAGTFGTQSQVTDQEWASYPLGKIPSWCIVAVASRLVDA